MKRKHMISGLFLILLAAITAWILIKSSDLPAVISAIKKMEARWLLICIVVALLFVALEGVIIWYLLHPLNAAATLMRCISWSFIGNFFSGITPSATGGQPAQLYYMKNKGIKLSESTPVLMGVAVLYKFVLVMVGMGIFIFWRENLFRYLGKYMWIYYLGFGLNVILVLILGFIMLSPKSARMIVLAIEKLLLRIRFLKPSDQRTARLVKAVDEYQEVVVYFKSHKGKMLIAVGLTLLQRCCAFSLSCLVYLGMGLEGANLLTVVLLQACIIISSDMLPLPGSVGITEMLYGIVFSSIFPGGFLMASMCISRGVSFYLVLIISLIVFMCVTLRISRQKSD